MEKTTKYTYQGFPFSSEAEYKEGKKEAEVVAYIRSQADLSNIKTVVKLYNRLIEKGTLETVLGIAFLQELRSRALESGVVNESSLAPLPSPEKSVKETPKPLSKEQKLSAMYKNRAKNLTVAVVALCIVIVVLFAIRLYGTASPFTDYEQKVLDEYAGWKEELTQKEETLHMWERSLTEWEAELTEREKALE